MVTTHFEEVAIRFTGSESAAARYAVLAGRVRDHHGDHRQNQKNQGDSLAMAAEM